MSESEIQRIWAKLDTMGRQYERLATLLENQADMLSEVRGDVKNIAARGCSRSATHDDHEQRLRSVETTRNLAVGGAGVAGSIIGTIGGWLMTRLGH